MVNEVAKIDEMSKEDAITVLGNSLYPGAKRESIELVLSYCRMNGLDPFLKPVHIVPTSVKIGDNKWEKRDVLMPGIADYRIKAARSGEYGGKSEPEFGPDITERFDNITVTYPAWCRITVKRIVQGQPRDFTAVERWLENYATAGRDTEAPNAMWRKRAYGQLAKVAEAQALRMAFPEFSAGYTAEEMEGKTLEPHNGPTIDAKPEPRPRAATSSAREAINAETPLRQPEQSAPTNGHGKRTVAQFFDALELALRDAKRSPNVAEEIDRIVTGEDVLRAQDHFAKPGMERHKERLARLIADALVLLNKTHEPPDDEMPAEKSVEAAV